MKSSSLSIMVFGLYMVFVVGIGFMLIPLPILHAFGLDAGDDTWIRFVGMLAFVLGFYYIQVARAGLEEFIPWTIQSRIFAATFMLVLVMLKMTGPGLLLFAAIDAAAAAWTWVTLRPAK